MRLHRWVGLTLAAFLISSGLTGSIIAFHEELDAWLNPDLFTTTIGAPLSPQRLVDRIEAQRPGTSVRYIIDRPATGWSAVAFLGSRSGSALSEDQVFADPVTGQVIGGRLYAACCFSRHALIPFIYRFHYTLALGPFGGWVMGIAAILWALDCINGFLLTLPPHLRSSRQVAWKQWRLAWTMKMSGGGIRRLFDLHRAVSLWLWLVLFGVAISGVSLALPRTFHTVLAYALPMSTEPHTSSSASSDTPIANLDILQTRAVAAAVAAGWRGGPPIALFRFNGATTFYFSQDGSTRGRGFGAWQVRLDPRGVARVVRPGTGRAGDMVAAVQMPWHNGRLIGLPGRILIAVSGVATALLTITGVLIWSRKRTARVAMTRRRKAPSGVRAGVDK